MLGSSALAAPVEARGADILPPVSIGHRRPPLPRQRGQQRQLSARHQLARDERNQYHPLIPRLEHAEGRCLTCVAWN